MVTLLACRPACSSRQLRTPGPLHASHQPARSAWVAAPRPRARQHHPAVQPVTATAAAASTADPYSTPAPQAGFTWQVGRGSRRRQPAGHQQAMHGLPNRPLRLPTRLLHPACLRLRRAPSCCRWPFQYPWAPRCASWWRAQRRYQSRAGTCCASLCRQSQVGGGSCGRRQAEQAMMQGACTCCSRWT